MSNKKRFIKMHIYENAFRRRNSLLHEANESDKISKQSR